MTPPLALTAVQLNIIARAQKNLRSRGWPFREMVEARLAGLDADEIDDDAVHFAATEVVRRISRPWPPMILPADPSPAAIAAQLDALAARTGNAAFTRAAKALLAPVSPGREPIDDALALAEAAEIARRNPAMSRWSVLMLVARRLGPLGKERSTAERLRRKWGKTVSVRNIHEIAISGKAGGLFLGAEITKETV